MVDWGTHNRSYSWRTRMLLSAPRRNLLLSMQRPISFISCFPHCTRCSVFLVCLFCTFSKEALHTYYFSGEAIGLGPRRSAFREALEIMLQKEGNWNELGDTMVPNTSPVTEDRYWMVAGGLLALTLMIGESLHPVSPMLTYALLSHVHHQPTPNTVMNLSLGFIRQIQSSKAITLLPWMIVPPGQDWKTLPEPHKLLLRDLITNLDLDVSTWRSLYSSCEINCCLLATSNIKPNVKSQCPMDCSYRHLCNVWSQLLFCFASISANG